MAKVIVLPAARSALRSALMVIPFLAGASCRQAICSGSMSCLELQVKADSFPGTGTLEVVLVGNSCNVLARYNQTLPEATALSERVEVRLDDPTSFPPLNEPVARVVVLAWPKSGLPWTGAVPWPQGMPTATPLSVELFAPKTELKLHSELHSLSGVTALVALPDATMPQVMFLADGSFGNIPLTTAHTFGTVSGPEGGLGNNLQSLTSTVFNSKIRSSFIYQNNSLIGFRESDFYFNKSCNNTGKFNLNSLEAIWSSVINPPLGHLAPQLLFIPTDSSTINLVDVDCTEIPSPGPKSPFLVNVTKPTHLLSAFYPPVDSTRLVAIMDPDKLTVFDPQTLTPKWLHAVAGDLVALEFVDTKQNSLVDIVVGTKQAELSFFREKSDGFELDPGFQQPIKLGNFSSNTLKKFKFGDFNGDTLLDVALAVDSPTSDSSEIQLWFGDGHGKFVAGTSIPKQDVAALASLGRNTTAQDGVCADDLIVGGDNVVVLFSVSP